MLSVVPSELWGTVRDHRSLEFEAQLLTKRPFCVDLCSTIFPLELGRASRHSSYITNYEHSVILQRRTRLCQPRPTGQVKNSLMIFTAAVRISPAIYTMKSVQTSIRCNVVFGPSFIYVLKLPFFSDSAVRSDGGIHGEVPVTRVGIVHTCSRLEITVSKISAWSKE